MNNRKFGALSSSVDPQKLATSVQGFLKVAGGLLAYWGFSQIGGDVTSVADQVGVVVTLGYSFYGGAETLYGLCRKALVSIHSAWELYKSRS